MLPVKKTSRTRTRTRRSHHRLKPTSYALCRKCSQAILPHRACTNCGYVNQDMNLTIRQWECGGCGETHDRDLNAAINILKEGKRNKNISAGTVDYRSGGEIRPAITGTVDEASKVLK